MTSGGDRGRRSDPPARLRASAVTRKGHRAEPKTNGIPARGRGIPGGAFLFDLYEEDAQPIWGVGSEALWVPGEALMLAGSQGVGKGTLAQQLVLSRLGIRPARFLGYKVAPLGRSRKLLYLALDRPRQIQRSLRRMVTEADRRALDRRLMVWNGPLAHLDVANKPYALAEWIAETHPTVGDIVVDSLKDLAVGLSSDDVGAAVNQAIQALLASGREVLLLHHTRKATAGNRAPDKLDDVYGSNWLTAGVGSVIFVKGEPGASFVELRHLKQPFDVVGPLRITHDHYNGVSRVRDVELAAIDVLRSAGRGGATLDRVALELFGSRSKAALARARRQLDKLVDRGAAEYERGAAGGAGGGATRHPRWRLRNRQ